MKLSTRLKYVFAALIMGAIVVFDHLWAGWLPNDYPYATWIHYGLLAPVGFCLAVSLGMNTGNPERSVFATTCGVAATLLLAVLPEMNMGIVLNRFVPLVVGAFIQWLFVRKKRCQPRPILRVIIKPHCFIKKQPALTGFLSIFILFLHYQSCWIIMF